jgi:hypothetical protein
VIRSWLTFASKSVIPNVSSTLVIKKNKTSSSGNIPKNKIPVVWLGEIDQVVSFSATISISERYIPGTKIAQKTNLR